MGEQLRQPHNWGQGPVARSGCQQPATLGKRPLPSRDPWILSVFLAERPVLTAPRDHSVRGRSPGIVFRLYNRVLEEAAPSVSHRGPARGAVRASRRAPCDLFTSPRTLMPAYFGLPRHFYFWCVWLFLVL